jgi:Fe-S-cluster containining protein
MQSKDDPLAKLLDAVAQFNQIIRPAILGPNCIDRQICDGNCCFIRIDVPKVLAEYYIAHGWANKDQFLRGDVFTFVIDVDMRKLRCTFYDPQLNGCALHQTGMKPPQCWVYPTGLQPEEVVDRCKKAAGWRISDPPAVRKAKEIIDYYFTLCKKEAEDENNSQAIHHRLRKNLRMQLLERTPASVAGVLDTWDEFIPLSGDGMNVGIRSFCRKYQCEKNYFGCERICAAVVNEIMQFLDKFLAHYIVIKGFKREYSFLELKAFADGESPSS